LRGDGEGTGWGNIHGDLGQGLRLPSFGKGRGQEGRKGKEQEGAEGEGECGSPITEDPVVKDGDHSPSSDWWETDGKWGVSREGEFEEGGVGGDGDEGSQPDHWSIFTPRPPPLDSENRSEENNKRPKRMPLGSDFKEVPTSCVGITKHESGTEHSDVPAESISHLLTKVNPRPIEDKGGAAGNHSKVARSEEATPAGGGKRRRRKKGGKKRRKRGREEEIMSEGGASQEGGGGDEGEGLR